MSSHKGAWQHELVPPISRSPHPAYSAHCVLLGTSPVQQDPGGTEPRGEDRDIPDSRNALVLYCWCAPCLGGCPHPSLRDSPPCPPGRKLGAAFHRHLHPLPVHRAEWLVWLEWLPGRPSLSSAAASVGSRFRSKLPSECLGQP